MKRFLPILVFIVTVSGMIAGNIKEERRMALQNLIERAEAGDAKALYDLAVLYDRGYDSIPVDSAESTRLYRLSAEKGYAPARNYLGFRYYNGEYIERNIDSALYWIDKAAVAGDVTAAGNLGFLLSQGEGIEHNSEKAIVWLQKAVAGGLPTAMSLLGDIYRKGESCEADTLKAIELYEQAHNAGVADAEMRLLAMMGYKWQELSADSAFNLGLRFYNEGAAIAGTELLQIAARQGIPRAKTILGDAYSRGNGVEYDHEKSVRYFFEGAMDGDPSAEYIIGELLEFFPDMLDDLVSQYLSEKKVIPEITKEDLSSPDFWYEKASGNGVNDAESAYEILFSQ